MKKRRTTILLVLFACICASAATGLYFAFRKASTEEHYLRLREGMSREEVERILGGHSSEIHADTETWYGTFGSIRANFDENGKLARCILYAPAAHSLAGLYERIEKDVRWRLNPTPYDCEFLSGGSYGKVKMIVPPDDRDVVPPRRLVIFETDGASSTRP